MSTMKPIGAFAKALCALSLVAASAPAWSDANPPKYEMAVFSDGNHGIKILSGKYDQAIDKINAKNSAADSLHAQTNLCVAYTKAGKLDAAEKACDEAVIAAKSLKKASSPSFIGTSPAQTRARYVAIALSNRGVVRAVQGDLEAARKDFDAALAENAGISSVQANLERLNTEDETA